jgi:hypothetical protein
VSRGELLAAALLDPDGTWGSCAQDGGALAVVLAGAAARAAALLEGDAADPDYQRRFGAVAAHASVAEILVMRDAVSGLTRDALDREAARYAWSAIELAMRTTRSAELAALGEWALRAMAGGPADEPLDRALARERLAVAQP